MPSSQLTTRTQLETERNNFLLHEQRIIQERDEILRNIHNHLEQLDAGKFYILCLVCIFALIWYTCYIAMHTSCSLVGYIIIDHTNISYRLCISYVFRDCTSWWNGTRCVLFLGKQYSCGIRTLNRSLPCNSEQRIHCNYNKKA